ncbi:MAG: hypothetical protein DCC57_17195 [Chloroflexi bacterium]|nr:MAG: hypothetical protein DCC57_17195 [Chloroflexota bacterium]
MSLTLQTTPTAQIRIGHARADITPPVGIYHPMWGAARHHRATGIHRPLAADILVFAAADGSSPWAQAQFDMVGLGPDDHKAMAAAIAAGAGLPADRVVLAYSHTHAGGLFSRDRATLPGGELIVPYLDTVRAKVQAAAALAAAQMGDATLSYGVGRCDLAANRDYWDEQRGLYACGFNPDARADDTLLVVRAAAPDGRRLLTLVNYACHPTTLAWDNTLVSPDYVGALRATVEQATGAPAVFTLGACGDLGPRHGFTGDLAVADRNGRRLGHAALAALEALDPPGHDFAYAGPVVSGATLGTWLPAPQSETRQAEARRFGGGRYMVDLPQKPRPDADALQRELADWLARQHEADAAGDASAARDYGARAERARRWLNRLTSLPAGDRYPYPFTVRRMGDGFWVGVGGEPYNYLQTELRRRFPDHPVVVTVLAGESGVAYLLPADRYGKGLYQEEPSILAPGCLETLIDAVTARMTELL